MSLTIYDEYEQGFLAFWEPIVTTVLNNVSKLSAASYGPSIEEFLLWWMQSGESNPIIAVSAYRCYMLDEKKLKPATVNKKLSAIRKLFETASVIGIGKENWPFTTEVASAVKGVKNIRQDGNIFGTRLNADQLNQLCNAPDPDTVLGRRDRAVLALLIACALRRSEVCNLTWDHIRQVEGIYIIGDLRGKHGRIRNVGMAPWVHKRLLEYSPRGKSDEKIIRSYDRHGNPREGITPQAIYKIVKKYGNMLGFDITPHDLRRSNSAESRKRGAKIEDIRDSLGHSSSVVTEKYIGQTGSLETMSRIWEEFKE